MIFGKKKQPTRKEIRKSRPLRNETLEYMERDGNVVIRVPLEQRGGIYKWVSRYAPAETHKEVELEELGSFVWKLCDGKHTCEGIAAKLREEYKLTKVESEASLVSFLETLARRRYVTLLVKSK